MLSMIYVIIIILFLVHIFWSWNNTRYFENKLLQLAYIIVGTIIITLLTYIIFQISKNGVNYINKEIIARIRNIILLTFVPINGFIILPQIARTMEKIKKDEITSKRLKVRIIIFLIIIVMVTIFECSYFKSIQNGVLEIINLK